MFWKLCCWWELQEPYVHVVSRGMSKVFIRTGVFVVTGPAAQMSVSAGNCAWSLLYMDSAWCFVCLYCILSCISCVYKMRYQWENPSCPIQRGARPHRARVWALSGCLQNESRQSELARRSVGRKVSWLFECKMWIFLTIQNKTSWQNLWVERMMSKVCVWMEIKVAHLGYLVVQPSCLE